MVRDFDVEGIIAQRMQFCDNWGYESKMLGDVMKEETILFLRLEKEYFWAVWVNSEPGIRHF